MSNPADHPRNTDIGRALEQKSAASLFHTSGSAFEIGLAFSVPGSHRMVLLENSAPMAKFFGQWLVNFPLPVLIRVIPQSVINMTVVKPSRVI